jgi:hypothetical protein
VLDFSLFYHDGLCRFKRTFVDCNFYYFFPRTGYDHETDEDWAIMTKKEELVIGDFNRRCRENEEETLRIKKEDEDDKRF